MTGYGASHYEEDGVKIYVEIKSLNSKYFDALIKLPKEFSEHELEIKSLLGETLKRGKVNLTVDYELGRCSENKAINEEAFFTYYNNLNELARKTGDQSAPLFNLALQFPEVTVPSEHHPTEEEWSVILSVIKKAIVACDNYRVSEGNKLSPVLIENINVIQDKLNAVKEADPQRVEGIKSRIKNNLREHLGDDKIDQNRFEQELIFFLEKLDINEEQVRLESHLKYFSETLDSPESQGKKLGFITQEIGREINTTGSKANNAEIQHLVVEMKEELEKIREQLLNIL